MFQIIIVINEGSREEDISPILSIKMNWALFINV